MTDLNDHYKPETVESNVKQYWNENQVYKKVKKHNEGNETFYFLDGPPFTSGRMHCGTAWGKMLKDAFLRYYRMKGYDVWARPGYDTHGLPVEVKVEKENDFSSKKDIEKYGVSEFVQECREYVREQKEVMDEEFSDLGVWMDWNNPYMTMNLEYMNSVWGAFYQLYNDNLVSRGFDVLNTCPRCETTLSDSELEYDNRNVEAAYVGFELEDEDSILVTWTTTPWTVVGNQFVAVDENDVYARVKADGQLYYVAESCVDNLMETLNAEDFAVIETVDGSDLVGKSYKHPLSQYVDGLPERDYTVAHADYVNSEKTGLVHSAPGFGHEDYERGSELEMVPFSPVEEDGTFSDSAGDYFSGKFVHSSGSEHVMNALDSEDALLAVEEYSHEYPHCPRCDTDVVFRATEQWMVEVTSFKEKLDSAVDETQWFPQEARDDRFRKTVQNAPNWNVSRQRYWGTPLPVWVCESCEKDTVVSSAQDLYNKSKNLDEKPDDLHRPLVDDVVVVCDKCGSDSHRVEDVLDVWFDSSVASWASLGANPNDNPTPEGWPSNLIVEGHDQTRGWFLMQLYMGVAVAGQAPYEDVLMHGFAMLDGEPMSKSRGHVLRPPEVIEEYGRDCLRGYMLSNEQQENDVNMTSDMQGVSNMKQKLDIVWNVYRFALMYMGEDNYELHPELMTSSEKRRTLDNWVLSKLDTVIEESTRAFENRQPNKALQSVLDFIVEDVSRYYVKSIRNRVWSEDYTEDKNCAYDTLGTVLHNTLRLLSPFTPHLTEQLYTYLPSSNKLESVHMEEWPEPYGLQNSELENRVGNLQSVENAVARARDKLGRKHRWPVENVYVETQDDEVADSLHKSKELMLEKMNANRLNVVRKFEETNKTVVPDMAVMGPKYGNDAQCVASYVQNRKLSELPLNVETNSKSYTVTRDDVEVVESLPDRFTVVDEDKFTVYVDGKLTDENLMEGMVRDLVRYAQESRSRMNLDMSQRVLMALETDSDKLEAAVEKYKDYISKEVRVDSFAESCENCDYTDQFIVNEHSVTLGLSER